MRLLTQLFNNGHSHRQSDEPSHEAAASYALFQLFLCHALQHKKEMKKGGWEGKKENRRLKENDTKTPTNYLDEVLCQRLEATSV